MLRIILIGVAGLFGFLVLCAVGLVVVARIVNRRMERRVRREGRPVMAALVMANNSLHDADGRSQVPGVVIFSFDEPDSQLRERLSAIAEECFDLYTAPEVETDNDALFDFALLLKDDMYDADRRNRVPQDLARSDGVHVADLWIHRDRLVPGWQNHRVIACVATGSDEGEIVMLPPDDPAAGQIYSTAGVTNF